MTPKTLAEQKSYVEKAETGLANAKAFDAKVTELRRVIAQAFSPLVSALDFTTDIVLRGADKPQSSDIDNSDMMLRHKIGIAIHQFTISGPTTILEKVDEIGQLGVQCGAFDQEQFSAKRGKIKAALAELKDNAEAFNARLYHGDSWRADVIDAEALYPDMFSGPIWNVVNRWVIEALQPAAVRGVQNATWDLNVARSNLAALRPSTAEPNA
jgi:hypothetical protein